MKKIMMLVVVLSFFSFSDEIIVDRTVQDSITKDFDQDGKYSAYEKALRKAQESVYVTLPEKRGYWYTTLDKIKAEEAELLPDETARMRRR
ncbi:hypothetical protein [Sebaldella sp. S0638]|uniref:hypothetical protein n=1 Tax=Sebaldella sp. S0638 TaxID=2957809 RepID=UPI00209DEBFA|nr:hypothetical protein [Sebaldella sp. S0638]MCP1223482.1 hypothetical protein [Sebaldella sp. S0638]